MIFLNYYFKFNRVVVSFLPFFFFFVFLFCVEHSIRMMVILKLGKKLEDVAQVGPRRMNIRVSG